MVVSANEANAALYDVIRIDHFIGIVNYWSIPASCPTAVEGEWRKGPGRHLTKVIRKATKGSDIIAEDLGIVSDKVRALINETGWPGMKILEFAFDGDASNEYLPHQYKNTNCLVYGVRMIIRHCLVIMETNRQRIKIYDELSAY